MRVRRSTMGLVGMAMLALSACSSTDQPMLMNAAAQLSGPDEFGIVPTRPLEQPSDLTALPTPTPGGDNLGDQNPRADAAAALGGSRAAATRSNSVPAADGALVARANRFGTSAEIRAELAAADLEFRRVNDGRLLERLFSVNVYHRAYRASSLDQYAELERWRARGVQTSAAPPNPAN
jgi:hypothetical protein